jgi:hypothetical protein
MRSDAANCWTAIRGGLASEYNALGSRRSVLTRLHLLQDSVNVEGRRLLPLRKIP